MGTHSSSSRVWTVRDKQWGKKTGEEAGMDFFCKLLACPQLCSKDEKLKTDHLRSPDKFIRQIEQTPIRFASIWQS